MKVEKDLREADGVQDERRNGKTGGNSRVAAASGF